MVSKTPIYVLIPDKAEFMSWSLLVHFWTNRKIHVIVLVGAKTFKTKVIENTIAPTWNAYFEVHIYLRVFILYKF